MHKHSWVLLMAAPLWATAQTASQEPVKTLGVVTVTSVQPTSLPTQIPTTVESMTREQIETSINATDSEDALKYLPSLLVRKRYIGDYNHAVLSSRASGTGNSARSAVYADGVLLSNYLGNGATYAPRWGLVTPEEIERVDVMYGPFSAAYPGNSVGAIVDYVTRMPSKFEAHAKLSYFEQPFDLYGTSKTFRGSQASASLGNRSGDWSWWMNFNRTDSQGQPLTFAFKEVSSGGAPGASTPVQGAVPVLNRSNVPWYILGTATQYHTVQDHAKFKLAYDFSPTVRASYTLGLWQNDAQGRPQSYLRDAAGRTVYTGAVNINGRSFNVLPSDFSQSNEQLNHLMHGLSVKSHTEGIWDWEVATSVYHYDKDELRSAASNGTGATLQDQDGTGWSNLALKGTWRPQGKGGAHVVDFGFQQERYKLRIAKYNLTGNWETAAPGTLANDVSGRTQLRSLYAQDTWTWDPKWKAVLGLRWENWQAYDGFTAFTAASQLRYAKRDESFTSPKAVLAYQWRKDTVLKFSTGKAVRMPTVSELYGATSTTNSQYINDPNLRPEKSWTSELSLEQDWGNSVVRLSYFHENVKDSLYSQTVFDALAGKNISRVQNVDRIATQGVELSFAGNDVVRKGLDLNATLTYADSVIKANQGFVVTPGDTIGKQQPRVPYWRASVVTTYRFAENWSASLGARYSGKQYFTLDNSDPNGFAYMGASKYFTTDLRLNYQVDKQWRASFGIDNLNNYKYWNFHPYPQRTYMVELKFDL